MKSLAKIQENILALAAGHLGNFYLAGGTALSLYYFHHRESDDLDFFSQEFFGQRVREAITGLSASLKKEIRLVAQELSKKHGAMMVYHVELGKGVVLKIDFVQDVLALIKPLRTIDGIRVLSLEDIYLRKIYAVSGGMISLDTVGQNTVTGGRQEAKDLFDLYFLSHTFMRLSVFVEKYCNQIMKEGLIRWYRTFSRLEMKMGLAELKAEKGVEFADIERHLGKEVERILTKEIE